MKSLASTVEEYLKSLAPDRREALQAVRRVILANLDRDYEEGMQYGMIGYYVPHRVFPDGYHCDPKQPLTFAGLASQKNHMALYLMCIYGSAEHQRWFTEAWKKTGKKLDMSKSCVRFRKLSELPLEVIGEAIRRVPARAYVASYVELRGQLAKRTVRGPPGDAAPARGAGPSRAKPARAAAARKSRPARPRAGRRA